MELTKENIERLLLDVALYVRAIENYSECVGTDSEGLESKMLALHTSDLRARQNAMDVYYANKSSLDFWEEQSKRGMDNV